ncbi:MAG: catalase [Acetobacterium sp.]
MSKEFMMNNSEKTRPKKALVLQGKSQLGAVDDLEKITGADYPGHNTTLGVSISDNKNSLRSNPKDSILLEDFVLHEEIAHCDHKYILEGIVKTRVTGDHGFFDLTAF